MSIPFTKAHGAKNDFLLTWIESVPPQAQLPELAQAICDRATGVGADGWLLVDERPGIRLFNADGSEAELSGNGTRCAAAFLWHTGNGREVLEIETGAGRKTVRLLSRDGLLFEFEMNMGRPRVLARSFSLPLRAGSHDVTLIDCGNPQCSVPVNDFNFDWIALGAEIEAHPHFPKHTNVSFIRPVNTHTIEVRIFERGVGRTLSSGTGCTGAAVCAIERGVVTSPVRVLTEAGPLELRWDDEVYLTGPAVVVAEGRYLYDGE